MHLKILRQLLWMSKYAFHGIVIQMTLTGMLVAAPGNAQHKSVDDIVISVNWKSIGFTEVLDDLEKKTELYFSFNSETVETSNIITLVENKKSLRIILELLSKDLGVSFKRVNGNIHVYKKPNNEIEVVEEKFGALDKDIQGRVTDDDGEPLPGASIIVKGSSLGTITGTDGAYVLSVPDDAETLVVSFIGFVEQEISIGNRSVIDFVMIADVTQLEELVVVGYGTESKRNLTSSVASVDAKQLQEIPATSLGSAIAGRIPGVAITQTGGKPGRTSGITVRGATSGGFRGGSEPLYVIDNVISSKELFDLLDVNEVESVSVLKDAASASVYGARAANGVVLVTTRSGQTGKARIQYTSTVGTTKPSRIPKFTTPFEHATLTNQALEFGNIDPADARFFNNAELAYLENNNFGNTIDQIGVNPLLQRHALNVSGGSERVDYFLGGSYVKETGNFDNLEFQKYNLRAKVNAKVTEDLNIGLNISNNADVRDEFYWRWNGTGDDFDEDFGDFYRTATRGGRWAPLFIDGQPVANFNGWNPGNITNEGQGTFDRRNWTTNASINLDYSPSFVEGLKVGAMFNTIAIQRNTTWLRRQLTDFTFANATGNRFDLTNEVIGERVRNDDGADSDSFQESYENERSNQFNFRLNYDNTFGDHGIRGFFVYEQWEQNEKFFSALRRNLLSREVSQLFATDPDPAGQFGNGNSAEDGRQSYIGGLGYTFRDRYILNATFRYDGSVRFADDERFGFFPSVSAAWIVSEESFFQDAVGFMDFFKVRFSVGKTGNDNVLGEDPLPSDRFPYVQSYEAAGTGAVLGTGDVLTQAIGIGALSNPLITWEKQTSVNLGFDFKTLNNKLDVSLDLFKNTKTDLYGDRTELVPSILGATLPPENYGEIEIKGLELTANYSDKLSSSLSYSVGFNLGYAIDEVVEFDEPENRRPHEILTGHSTDRIRALTADGIINTQAQVDALEAAGYTAFGRAPYLGMLFLQDLRGNPIDDPDGNTPDGIVDDNDFGFVADHSEALTTYGITLGLKWKNFRLDGFFQGFAGLKRIMPQNSRFTFPAAGEGSWDVWAKKSYHPTTNPDGTYPRFVDWGAGGELYMEHNSSFFLESAGFLRLKNVNLSYSLPSSIASKVGLSSANIFANGTNLFVISKIKDYDPETTGSTIPTNKTYSLGVQLTF